MSSDHPLRQLPSVDEVLRQPAIARLIHEYPRGEVAAVVRDRLALRREAWRGGESLDDLAQLALEVRRALMERQRPNLRRVINATGVVLHTGLGRAPLAPEAVEAIVEIAGGYCNLELDLSTGERGDRHAHVRDLLCELTGAEDALIVNNNAAATVLALRAVAGSGGVLISRGELVEIGGSYRMPDVMAAAGCRMIEVGTTNRTHLRDYERALTEDVSAVVRVHPSNYRVVGFTARPSIEELVQFCGNAEKRLGRPLPLIDDLGSGLLDQLETPDSADPAAPATRLDEPTVRESVAAGASLTLFSGDKLLGGPQCGIVVGRERLITRLHRDPMMRAFRPDKMTFAALEATLRIYRDPQRLAERLPTLRMLVATPTALRPVAEALAEGCRRALEGATIELREEAGFAGGGTLPAVALPSLVVAVRIPGVDAAHLATRLRGGDPAVVARVHDGAFLMDCRTVEASQIGELCAALRTAASEL